MDVGDGSPIYLGDPGDDYRNPKSLAASTCSVYVYVEDVDAHHTRATQAGATIIDPLTDQTYGDRRYGAEDPEGHQWFFATRVRETRPDEWGAEAAR
jgi:PhnB protein